MSRLLRLISWISLVCLQESFVLSLNHFDPMIQFAYPLSHVQTIRHQACQAVYAVQNNNCEGAMSLLEDVRSLLSYRHNLSEDDKAYLQAMIDHLNSLIYHLENDQDRSKIIELLHDVEQQF